MQPDNQNIGPLSSISAGKRVRILGIQAGRELNRRLAEMGLLMNEEVTVIQNDGTGQIIINVKNSKLILGRGMSQKILVAQV